MQRKAPGWTSPGASFKECILDTIIKKIKQLSAVPVAEHSALPEALLPA